MSLIYQNDIGAKIVALTKTVTFPTPSTFVLMITKPSGATIEWSVVADLSTGEMVHTTVAGELNEAGEYKAQIRGLINGTDDQGSDENSFYIFKRLY